MHPSPQQLGVSSTSQSSPPARSHALHNLSWLPSAARPDSGRAASGSPVSLASFYASCSGTAMYSDYSQDTSASVRQGSQSSSSSDSRTLTFRRTAARIRPGLVLEDSPFDSTSPVPRHSGNRRSMADYRETAAKRLNFSEAVTPCVSHFATHAELSAGELATLAAAHQAGCQDRSCMSALLPVLPSPHGFSCDDACHQGITIGSPQPASGSAGVTPCPHLIVSDTQTLSVSQEVITISPVECIPLQSGSHCSQQPADGLLGHSRKVQSPAASQLGAKYATFLPAHADREAEVITISSSCEDETSPPLAWTATRTPRRRVVIATDSDTEDEGHSECTRPNPVATIDAARRDSESAARHVAHDAPSMRQNFSSCTPGQGTQQLEDSRANDQLETANGSAQTLSSRGSTPPWMSCHRPSHPPAADSTSAVSTAVNTGFSGGRVSTKPVQRVLFSDGPGVDYLCVVLQ